MLRSQMRNIAPFLTLICLTGFFAVASPSFATLDNLGNILTQISVTGIIAVGLTFVILCAEIDLSVASIANVTGIAVAYFTAAGILRQHRQHADARLGRDPAGAGALRVARPRQCVRADA